MAKATFFNFAIHFRHNKNERSTGLIQEKLPADRNGRAGRQSVKNRFF